MLHRLIIRNIVLIDRLELEFSSGLSVLTGETGAGKSILLDAFSLALGARGDGSLVRHGEDQGQVSAVFELPHAHPAWLIACEAGIDPEDQMILRRVQMADGRTRAYINDQPVSIQILKGIGAALVEIHGQHADRALMDASVHRFILDEFGQLGKDTKEIRDISALLRRLKQEYVQQKENIEKLLKEADYLRHAEEELRSLAPQPGEEEELSKERQLMMNSEKLTQNLNEAFDSIGGSSSVIPLFSAILRKLERQKDLAPKILDPVIHSLDETLNALDDTQSVIRQALSATEFDPHELERIEERLFALRAAARKYNTQTDALSLLCEQYARELQIIEAGEHNLSEQQNKVAEADTHYIEAARILSAKREETARKLETAVNLELPPLKLDKARFMVQLDVNENSRDPTGFEQVEFWVQTNPGTRPGPLMKVASGGELSRFMLALKVVLADKGSAPTLIFDEVDSGAGGAVADAIGSRLAQLSGNVQVIAITHAPQVAARADHHFLISKHDSANKEHTETHVRALDAHERTDEIARMLAGAHITDEARAAALRLLEAGSRH